MYAEVSLMELSAYVCWKRAQAAKGGDVCKDYQAAWDILDCDVKVYWVPDDPWVVLAADPTWAPLLDDALPSANAVPAGLLGGHCWFEYKDPAAGIPYYHCPDTGTTTWLRPWATMAALQAYRKANNLLVMGRPP